MRLHLSTRVLLYAVAALFSLSLRAQDPSAANPVVPVSKGPQATATTEIKVIIDTDIGDDVDDVFALGLAFSSPELKIAGITTTWGDTHLRAQLVDRLLAETSLNGIPVAEGIPTHSKTPFTQARWAQANERVQPHPQAVDFLLRKIRENPGQITVIAIGPLTNIGAAIDQDAAAFRKVQRVVLMGGSIRRRYGDLGYAPDLGPEPEYNIVSDIPAAQKLFASGVPIFMMPLDSTQLKLDETKRELLFSAGTPLANALAALYYQWGHLTPTLFDVMAVAYVVQPNLCPAQPLHIDVDKDGYTRVISGTPNASACLDSDSDQFFRFLLPRLLRAPR